MIAKVFVDIPAAPVDKPFDYLIPESFVDFIEPGMRVIVPFGSSKRLGFVAGLEKTSAFAELKEIESVIDHLPILTEELLKLGKWLSETTLCLTISAYLAMLPAVMKANYKKLLIVRDKERLDDEFPDLAAFLANKKTVYWETIVAGAPQLLKPLQRALKKGIVAAEQHVKNQATKKKVKILSSALPPEALRQALGQLDNRSEKQKAVLHYFAENEEGRQIESAVLVKKLGVSRVTINRLVAKGWLLEKEADQYRDPYAGRKIEKTAALPLTEEQAAALAPIHADIESGRHRVFLCHGVTGSGKTEIYLQAIEKVIRAGKEAIVLVPEIALTPQMVNRFKGRFGGKVAVMHSALSRGEKYDEWRKVREGKVQVVVGARSAVFAPFNRLGLIIIDEEHETSYKQEENPRYHARDVAIYRAAYHHCPVVLGSATPSLESFARAKKGVYTLLSLKERFNHHPMPSVEMIDMREEMRAGNRSMFSRTLFEKLVSRLEKHEQSVLFLNRRGHSSFVMCRDCGYVMKCPHCDISLTYHRRHHLLKCHYCGHQEKTAAVCPSCGSDHLRYFGTGTEKVEEELNRLLPEARVVRMDVDTTQRKGSHEKLLRIFGEGRADILLGTQMIAKGLDFPKVTLVGVLAADSILHLPDFRASEKTFQLLTQVSGRAGRHDLPGEVVIQSYSPEHYAIVDAAHHDYQQFYQREMQMRFRHGYPPFYYLALVNVSHPQLTKAADAADRITQFLKRHLSANAQILGPAASVIPKIKDRYRYQCMVKYKKEPELLPALRKISDHYQAKAAKDDLYLSVDLNPFLLM